MYLWSGYDDPALYPAYVKKYGAAPDFAIWGDEEEGLLKLRSGFKPDVVFPCAYKIAKWYENGVLNEIDTAKLSHWPDVFESLKTIPAGMQDGKRVWVPIDWGQTSIIYRTDLCPEYVGNETWSILWDPKYKGRVAMFDSLTDGAVVAGIVAGLKDPFDYSSDENLAKVKAKLTELKPQLRYFVPDSASLEQGLATGEIVAVTGLERIHHPPAQAGIAGQVHGAEGGRHDLGLRPQHRQGHAAAGAGARDHRRHARSGVAGL